MTIKDKNIHKRAAISLSKIQGLGARGPLSGNPRYVIKASATEMLTWINERVIEEYIHATLDEAINAAAADNAVNRGDTIYILPGHTESILADSGVDIDIAGLNIIGLGNGEDRPIFTFATDTDADFKIAAANILIENLVFKCNIASQAMMIEVSGDDAEISNCEFREGTATGLNFITIGVTSDNEADRCNIHDCKFYTTTSGNYNSAINFAKDEVGVRVDNNNIYGYFAIAGIDVPSAGNVQVDCEMHDNEIVNLTSGQHAIHVDGTSSTGKIVRNLAITDSSYTAIDAGGLEMSRNRWNNFTDQGPDEAFPAPDVEGGMGSTANGRGGQFRYVDPDIASSGDGMTWNSAFSTVAAAITACGHNDTIKIMGSPNVSYPTGNDITENVTITATVNGLHIIGTGNGPEGTIWKGTAIDQQLITIEGRNCLIENIRFRPWGGTSGCAIYLVKDDPAGTHAAGTTIRNCIFRSTTEDALAGIQTRGANDVTIEDCTFKECVTGIAQPTTGTSIGYRSKIRRNFFDDGCTNAISLDCGDSIIHDNYFMGNSFTIIISTTSGESGVGGNKIFNNNLTLGQMLNKCTITATDDYSGEQAVMALDKARGETFYVDSDRTTSGLGTSPNTAFKTVLEAVDAISSTEHCTVYIKKGIYDAGEKLDLTAEGTRLIGAAGSGDMYGTSALKATASHDILEINANECEIIDLAFIQNTANKCIYVNSSGAARYKTFIKGCFFGGGTTQTYGVNGEGVDTVIEGCTFYSCVIGCETVGTTRTIRNNVFLLKAGDTAIEVMQSGGDQPNLRILDNIIRGADSNDTGIKFTGTPSEELFIMTGNKVTNCATPVTLAKYTSWYEDNYWGTEDWRYHAGDGREAAIARGADGNIFYVDGNVSTTGLDGKCWASAYNNLADALAASHDDIGDTHYRNFARRNTIYFIADALSQDLTKLAQKTDIVGLGSYSGIASKAGLNGTHIIEDADYYGCRWYNVWFREDSANPIFTLTPKNGGIEFHECEFDGTSGNATYGILVTTRCPGLIVDNCDFVAKSGAGFTTAAISIGVGQSNAVMIRDSRIAGAGIGILTNGASTFGFDSFILDNVMTTVGKCISDNSSADQGFHVIGNRCIVDTNNGTGTAYDIINNLACNNFITSADSQTHRVPDLDSDA